MKPPRRLTGSLAGWLFADLFLVLFITALATVPAEAWRSNEVSEPRTAARPTPSPTPTKTADCPVSYDLVPVRLVIQNVSQRKLLAGDGATQQDLLHKVDAEIGRANLSNHYAGLILAYGLDSNANRTTARAAAKEAGDVIKRNRPMFARASVKEFNYERPSGRKFYLDVYFFVEC